MKKIIFMAAIAGCLLTGMDATAQQGRRGDQRIDDRGQVTQRYDQRMDSRDQVVQRGDRRPVTGMRDNSLTASEMRQINFMKKDLQRTIFRAKADGFVSYREKMMIERKKNQLDRMMFNQRHDRQRGRF